MTDASNGKGTGSTVDWAPADTRQLSGGIAADGCAELYHELFHAYEGLRGIQDYSVCNNDTNIPTSEVRATFAEMRTVNSTTSRSARRTAARSCRTPRARARDASAWQSAAARWTWAGRRGVLGR